MAKHTKKRNTNRADALAEKEVEAVENVFKATAPRGLTVSALTKRVTKDLGYTPSVATVRNRVKFLLSEEKAHATGELGRMGAAIFAFGPRIIQAELNLPATKAPVVTPREAMVAQMTRIEEMLGAIMLDLNITLKAVEAK
jgi:hypothetical protein